MASKINWNIVLIGGAVVAGLYMFNKIKSGTPAQNYETGTTGEIISEATQPTIRTDLRQSGRIQRTDLRQSGRIQRTDLRQSGRIQRTDLRQSARTTRAIGRQSVKINRADERTSRLSIRQSGRTQRQAQRQQTLLKVGSGIKSAASSLFNRLKRKK